MKPNPKPFSYQPSTRRTLLVSALSLVLLPAVHADYASEVLSENPQVYYRFADSVATNDPLPGTAINIGSLGATGNGVYFSGARNSSTGPSPASGFVGFPAGNSALSLPDADGYVSAGQSLLNNRSAYTVMGWVKRGAIHSTRGGYFGQNDVLEFGDAAEGASIEAYTPSSGGLVTPNAAADDVWQFIALTASGESTILYINGVEMARFNATVADYGSSTFNFNVGGGGIFNDTGDFFRGEIDEVAMFDRALSPGRIQQLYDAALGNIVPEIVNNIPTVTPTGEIPEGKHYTLGVEVIGTPPFTYQWKLNGVNIPGATENTYSVSSAQVNSPNPTSPFSYSVVVSNTTSTTSDPLDVFVTPVLKWTSASASNSGKWDISSLSPSPLNWNTFTTNIPSAYDDNNVVLFDDSATVTTVELTEDVTPKSIYFNNSDKAYTLTGGFAVLAGSPGAATKDGTGTVLIENDLFDVNSLQVNAGKIQFGNGTTGELSVFAVVKVTGGEIAIKPPADSIYSNLSTFTGGQISFLGTGDLAVTGPLSGAGSELFDRDGTVLNTNSNSLSGTITINSGIVAYDGKQDVNRLAASKAVTVNPGATMEMRGVNPLPTDVNSIDPTLHQGTLRVVSGASTATGETGTSHAHLRNLTLDAGSVILSYSGQGSAYNGESFQLNGDINVTGSALSTIAFDNTANTGNAGVAMSATAPDLTHVFSVPNVAIGPDLKITAELEDGDSVTAGDAIISKTGGGTLLLDGNIAHSFSGATQITEGTFQANGSIIGPVTVAAGAFIDPGPSFATFTTGGLDLQGTYSCEINGPNSDRLIANGNVTFGPTAKISLTLSGAGATAAFYEVLSVTGTISGPTPMVTGVPPGYSLAVSGSSIAIVQSTLNTQPTITTTPPSGSENFNTNNGGFSISAPVSAQTDWTYSNGSWRSNGQASGGNGDDNTSNLNSPIYTVNQAGAIQLTFSHRYSFEVDFDGGDVQVSVNGGAFTPVPGTSFSQNGYTGTVPATVTHSLKGLEAFVGNSAGHPALITSICTVATAAAGDTIQVRFVSASDENTVGNLTPAGWEIDSFEITKALPNLMTLTWPIGSMQYSDNLQPPWTDLPGSSPLLIDTKATPKRFYRLKP